MYEHYDFTNTNDGTVLPELDGWFCYRNHRGGVRVIPTVKSILGYYKRATAAALFDLIPKWSLR